MRGLVFDGDQLRLTNKLIVREPSFGEAKIRVLRSGLCHTDLNMIDGGRIGTPVVLGHEAAGEVMGLGAGVTGFAIGDRVAVSTQTPCGTCRECLRGTPANCDITWGMTAAQPFLWEGTPTYSFSNVSSFAGEIVVKASQLYPVGDLPPEQAALIGCAVSTGYGAVRNLARASPGDRILVLGAGGIGVNAIATAALLGATVLAVDVQADKETIARRYGATEFLAVDRNMDADALSEALRDRLNPIDTAIECSGAPVAADAAIRATKRGGRVVLVGQSAADAEVRFDLNAFTLGKEIVSTLGGGASPSIDFSKLIALTRARQIDLGDQVTRVWPLAEFERAVSALRSGKVTRAVLDHTI